MDVIISRKMKVKETENEIRVGGLVNGETNPSYFKSIYLSDVTKIEVAIPIAYAPLAYIVTRTIDGVEQTPLNYSVSEHNISAVGY